MKYLRIVFLTLSLFITQIALAAVNINTADAETLANELNGVGMKKAESIIEYRKQHGPFKSVEQLLEVKGIGPAIIDKNRENILLK